jgi:hypothetical protein
LVSAASLARPVTFPGLRRPVASTGEQTLDSSRLLPEQEEADKEMTHTLSYNGENTLVQS